jgi:hypothetical protein
LGGRAEFVLASGRGACAGAGSESALAIASRRRAFRAAGGRRRRERDTRMRREGGAALGQDSRDCRANQRRVGLECAGLSVGRRRRTAFDFGRLYLLQSRRTRDAARDAPRSQRSERTHSDALRDLPIFAHEVGHEYHRDFDSSRAAVPNQIKELEADRFAGYTLKKLDVSATGLTPYWSMTGDEFGIGASHGSSAQRVGAFKEGWHEAEWSRAENSTSVTAATQQSIAPEDSTAAP